MAVTHMTPRGSGYTTAVNKAPAFSAGVVGYTGFRGTAALPAYAFEEDPDTGVYSNAADNLSFAAGGVEYMRLKSTPTFGSVTSTSATADLYGFQTKPNQGATTTGSVKGAEISPRIAGTFGAAGLTGLTVSPILKGTSGAGTVTDLRGIEITFTDENTAGRTITNQPAMIRMWHQLAGHTFTNGGPVGISMELHGGGTPWGFAFKFADDSGTGLADLASGVTTVNGAIKVQIGSTTGYIPTYQTYTPA